MKDSNDSKTADVLGYEGKSTENKNKKGYAGSKTDPQFKDMMETPPYLIDYVKHNFGCNIDLACLSSNAKFSERLAFDEIDSLSVSWSQLKCSTGFCNPPYSNLTPWLEKAVKEANKGFRSVFLIPTPNGDKWQDIVLNNALSITYITGRVSFIHPETKKPSKGNNRGSCLALFGKFGKPKILFKNANPRISVVSRKQIQEHYNERSKR